MSRQRNMWVSLVFLAMPQIAWAAPSAKEIMEKSDEARRLTDVTSSATLVATEVGRPDKVKTFTWWRKTTSGRRFNTLTRFHTPAEIRGEGILFLERDRDTTEVLLYLPNFKKVRRVESQSQSSSFMSSAFSYSDIAAPHADDFSHKQLRVEACPGEAAIKCFVIESIPATDAVRERLGYSRLVQWVHSEHYLPVQGEFYAIAGELAKRTQSAKIKKVDVAANKWMPHWIRIEDVRDKRSATLTFEQVKVNTGLSDSQFTQQMLQRE